VWTHENNTQQKVSILVRGGFHDTEETLEKSLRVVFNLREAK